MSLTATSHTLIMALICLIQHSPGATSWVAVQFPLDIVAYHHITNLVLRLRKCCFLAHQTDWNNLFGLGWLYQFSSPLYLLFISNTLSLKISIIIKHPGLEIIMRHTSHKENGCCFLTFPDEQICFSLFKTISFSCALVSVRGTSHVTPPPKKTSWISENAGI